jgi:hypothetical protein
MASASSGGEPVMASDEFIKPTHQSIHAQNPSPAADVEDYLVLKNMLVLIDRVSI